MPHSVYAQNALAHTYAHNAHTHTHTHAHTHTHTHTYTGLIGVGMSSLCNFNVPAMMISIAQCGLIAPLVRFSVTFPLVYHYFNGIRHVV